MDIVSTENDKIDDSVAPAEKVKTSGYGRKKRYNAWNGDWSKPIHYDRSESRSTKRIF
ncbi:MAG: hypothetical protein KZQ70_08080 [gamma proteobacterium symbiont of Lucinoma myriamae]|nr:hypothetical protein [gamma proteobacterium symbiont of Lucinoma myriamae]MCU7818335.1 hypothetical protein [gamma proteobacterium symbiont of Lucinoma myriamae]